MATMKGSRLNEEYVLLSPLGEGAMGVIYRGVHEATGQAVALKVIHPGHDEATRRRRERALHEEVSAIARMYHRRIVRIFDFGVVKQAPQELPGGSPFFAMELAAGSLSIADVGTWEEARAVLVQILDGLAHAHARGLLHRDLKPDNILLRGGDAVDTCLSDFGIAYTYRRTAEERSSGDILISMGSRGRRALGTPLYMAPEQATGSWRDWGAWTDLYALGVIGWELVTGSPPFVGRSAFAVVHQHMEAPLPEWRPRFPVPEGLLPWLERLLRKAPLARYLRAAAAARDLAALPGVAVGGGEFDDGLVEFLAPTETLDLEELLKTRVFERSFSDPLSRETPAKSALAEGMRSKSRTFGKLPTWRRGARSQRVKGQLPLLSMHGLREIPLQGREEERDRLWDALEGVLRSRRPGIAVVRGESGQGASSLGRWVAERANELGMALSLFVYHGPGVDNEQAFPLMLADMMKCQGISAEELEVRVARLVGRFGDPLTQELDTALFTALLRPFSRGGSQRTLGGQNDRFIAVERLLRRVGPAVIVLDEAQWGRESLGIVRHLQRVQPQEVPVLIVIVVAEDVLLERTEERFFLEQILAADFGDAMEVEVAALPDAECSDVLDLLAPLKPSLRKAIIGRSRGSPLYLHQLFSYLLEAGALGDDGGEFDLIDKLLLPSSVRDLWLARLDSFLDGESTEAFLLVSAVFGLEIQEERTMVVVRQLLADDGEGVEAQELMEELLGRGLVVRRGGQIFFAQNRLRQALLEILEAREDKRELILACEEYLAARSDKSSPWEHFEQRAQMLEWAGEQEKALEVCCQRLSRYQWTGDVHGPRALLRRMEALCSPYQLGQVESPREAQWQIEILRGWLGGSLELRNYAYEAIERLQEIETRLGISLTEEYRTL